MVDILQLLRRPSVAAVLQPLADVPERARVDHVVVVESLVGLRDVRARAFVVLTEAATAVVRDYQLDGALRAVANRGGGALVLTAGADLDPPRTALAIAAETGVAILLTRPNTLTDVLLRVDVELRGDAAVSLRRIQEVTDAITAWQGSAAGVESVLASVAAALHAAVHIADAEPSDGLSQPIDVEGAPPAWVAVQQGADGAACRFAVTLLAAALREHAYDQSRRGDAAVQSRADVLTEVLTTDASSATVLVERARAMGIPVDGWHTVVRVEIENFDALSGLDDVAAYDMGLTAARLATGVLDEAGSGWNRAGRGWFSLLIRTTRQPPMTALAHLDPARAVATRYMDRLLGQLPEAVLRCGIGTPQIGPAGLKASAAEARAALAAARARGVANQPVAFDASGMRKVLMDWYGSDAARDVVDRLIAPLASVEKSRRDDYLETLRVYLDTGESVTDTADALHVHRNTVKYRLDRLLEMLDIDRSDPDHRLLLHLACRAYFLGT